MRSLGLLVVVVIAGVTACGVNEETDGDKCYSFSSSLQSFDDASQSCSNRAYNLVSITNRFQNNYVFLQASVHFSKTFGRYWIGLKSDSSGTWYWRDGTTTGYLNWGPGEPRYKTDSCVQQDLSTGAWFTEQCQSLAQSVCSSINGGTPGTDPPTTTSSWVTDVPSIPTSSPADTSIGTTFGPTSATSPYPTSDASTTGEFVYPSTTGSTPLAKNCLLGITYEVRAEIANKENALIIFLSTLSIQSNIASIIKKGQASLVAFPFNNQTIGGFGTMKSADDFYDVIDTQIDAEHSQNGTNDILAGINGIVTQDIWINTEAEKTLIIISQFDDGVDDAMATANSLKDNNVTIFTVQNDPGNLRNLASAGKGFANLHVLMNATAESINAFFDNC